jgi:PPOX class probable F420-dependent enzyme
MDAAVRAALTAGRFAHLVTINPDGSPQISVVWTGVEDDEVVIAHLGEGAKVRNLRRDPRVSLSVEAEGRDAGGLDHWLAVHGTARVTPGGGPELLQRLARTYMGPDVTFPGPDAPPGNVIHVAVDRVGGVGPWS